MITLDIPGFGSIQITHLVADYNGTLACDGELLDGMRDRLDMLGRSMTLHILTGDTYGTAQGQLAGVKCQLETLGPSGQREAKKALVERLPIKELVAIGNGRNDVDMLRAARLAVAVMGEEGLASELVSASDLVVPSAIAALDLLLHPKRLLATLRA